MKNLRASEEPDIKELGRICQTMKDRRTQFGDKVNTRNHEARVPRKCYKGQSFEVGSKRKEVLMKSSDLKSTSKKLKRSDFNEALDLMNIVMENIENFCYKTCLEMITRKI